MSVSIPLSWINCANCHQPLYGAQSASASNEVVCVRCGAVNKIICGSGGGGASVAQKKLNTVWR